MNVAHPHHPIGPAARRAWRGICLTSLLALAACAPEYSPDVYASKAVQLANKVETGTVVGFREVEITTDGTIGTVTGGAVGGILGSQSGEIGLNAAIGGVTGSAVGGLIGAAIAHATSDTTGWEYIVRKPNGDMLSVTQKEPNPIPVGQKVLVITGPQARIVRDYSQDPPVVASEPPHTAPAAEETHLLGQLKPDGAGEDPDLAPAL